MSINNGIDELKKAGLNIFLSIKVSDLPNYIYNFSPEQQQKTLCLVGHGGRDFWNQLPHPLVLTEHPIDKYGHEKIQHFAKNSLNDQIEILFPSNELIFPIQRLSRFLNFSKQSPQGIDISLEYGLWFAFRGIFLTKNEIINTPLERFESPCNTCFDQPCLNQSTIMQGRIKCPIKTEHQYSVEQIQYHQSALTLFDT